MLLEALQTAPAPVTPRHRTFRSTLDALTDAFVDAVLFAVGRALLSDLAGALEPAPAKALPAARMARKDVRAVRTPKSTKAARPSVPAPSTRARRAPPTRHQLELPLDLHNYPETAIVDPDAVLRALPPQAPVLDVEEASPDVSLLAPALPSEPLRPASRPARSPVVVPAIEGRAPDPVPKAGEEILRAAGGGAVLRRRRSPAPPSTPTDAPE